MTYPVFPGQFTGIPGTLGVYGSNGYQGIPYPARVNPDGSLYPYPGEQRIATIDGGTVSTQTAWYQRGKPTDYRGASGS
jgi:hypothetical protein